VVRVAGQEFVHPATVLFNGGVFKATALKQRLLEVLNTWVRADGGQTVVELEGAELDLAVARGAAYYGWVRQGHGLRIRGGTARAYYVGVETAMPAVPGMGAAGARVCVAPFGMEEGTQADVPPQEFGVVVGGGHPLPFLRQLRPSRGCGGLDPGRSRGNPELEEVAPIETTLPVLPARKGNCSR